MFGSPRRRGVRRISFVRRVIVPLSWLALSVLVPAAATANEAAATTPEPPPEEQGWQPIRIDDALPDWASLSVQHRTRYEFLDGEFRRGVRGDRKILVLRTLVHGRVELLEGLRLGAELQDSRAEVNGDTFLNTTIVNAAELLRAYGELEREVFGGTLLAQAGRITMDVGSRRFVARNRYRNTINGFTGIDLQWENAGGTTLRAFWTLPVQRQPALFNQLRENEVRYDDEDFDLQFWGIYASHSALPIVDVGEFFVFGLHEQDEPNRRTRKRELYTPGFRLLRKPKVSRFDYTFETAFQFGRSRSTAAGPRLDHFAHFHHVEVGYTFDCAWSPRLAFEYDYASGDDRPSDGENGRFDTLFGARRFDYGPTGIFGPFARSNLNTPGIRLKLKPSRTVSSFLGFRSFWLADRSDAWTTSGLRDARGKSGSHVASQFEMRVRWDPLPGNLRLEAGWAHIFDGEFIQNAPNSPRPGDFDYFYAQFSLRL